MEATSEVEEKQFWSTKLLYLPTHLQRHQRPVLWNKMRQSLWTVMFESLLCADFDSTPLEECK